MIRFQHFQKDNFTPACSVAASLLVVNHLSAWNNDLFTHVFMCILLSQLCKCLCASYTFIHWSSTNKQVAYLQPNSFGHWWFSMAAKLVGHLQMVGFNVVYKSLEGFKWTTRNPSAYVFTCKQKATEITLPIIWVYWLDAWLPQVRIINVAVILVPFLCFEWTCVWPYTSGKVLPLPTTQLHKLSSPTWLFITVWRVHSHMTSLDVAVCSSKPTLTCCAGNSHR